MINTVNHFIIKYKVHMVCSPGAVAVKLRDIPQRVTFHTLIHFCRDTQKLMPSKQSLYMNISF